MGLLPSLEFDLSTLAEVEATLSDLAGPTRDEAPFTFADEAGPRPPSVSEWTPTAAETPPEGLLTSSDMFALENLEDPIPPEHLTLELDPPVLPADLASSLLEDAPHTPLPATPEIPELLISAGTEPGLPVVEAVSFEDLDDIALPGHLTLELDGPKWPRRFHLSSWTTCSWKIRLAIYSRRCLLATIRQTMSKSCYSIWMVWNWTTMNQHKTVRRFHQG